MNFLTLDVESTIKNDGNPFVKANKLCLVGLKDFRGAHHLYDIEYTDSPYGDALKEIKQRIESSDLLIGFNIKFDLHWIRRYINDIRFPPVFDCQLCEFLLLNQRTPYPALAEVVERRGLGRKLDVVANDYWNLGIDTPEVPRDLLETYLKGDLDLTEALFDQQRKELEGNRRKLFALQCEDLIILEEMEWNGLFYDIKKAEELSEQTKLEISKIDAELRDLVGIESFNYGSNDHLSCYLYGGTYLEEYREQYQRVLKDGTVKDKERTSKRPVTFKRRVKPLPRTEGAATRGLSEEALDKLNAERVESGKTPLGRRWSVEQKVLTRLRATGKAKQVIALILKRSELEKLESTYYGGLVKKMHELGWDNGHIHGQLNQCVAVTGRLSSSNPNLQNFAGKIKELFYSRFV